MSGKSSFGSMSREQRASFASRIRETVAGFETQEAAAAAGVSLTQLKNWMTGASAPSLLAIARLALVHNVDIRWIAYGSGPSEVGIRISEDRKRLDEVAKLLQLIGTAEEVRATCNSLEVIDLAPILALATKKLGEVLRWRATA